MPELPDIVVYIESLRSRLIGQPLEGVRFASPFLLRSYQIPISETHGKVVREILRMGKRIVFSFNDDLYLVLHLMIAGRLHWRASHAKLAGKFALAAFDFPIGSLLITEAGSKRRAALFVIRGMDSVRQLDPGGLEVLEADLDTFRHALTLETHTLKRALTDPHLFSGIGNAYSDEILHAAGLSPIKRTTQLTEEEIRRLYECTRGTLLLWLERLRGETGSRFPEKVTAFREGMSVHGRYRSPCPVCGDPVQRIVYAENETNYCPTCQTGGRLLADRSLSRLLKGDWPRSLADLDELYNKSHR